MERACGAPPSEVESGLLTETPELEVLTGPSSEVRGASAVLSSGESQRAKLPIAVSAEDPAMRPAVRIWALRLPLVRNDMGAPFSAPGPMVRLISDGLPEIDRKLAGGLLGVESHCRGKSAQYSTAHLNLTERVPASWAALRVPSPS